MTDVIGVDMETLETCPVCGGMELITPALRRRLYGNLFIEYSSCETCGLFFLNPRMTDHSTVEYYSGAYRRITLQDDDPQVVRRDRDAQERRAKIQTQLLEKHISKPKSALEIGCSAGYLLDAVHGLGVKKPVGVDPDMTFREVEPASKHAVYNDIHDIKPRPFDLILLSHSLEHFNHPLEFMSLLVNDYAKDGTTIMVEVPNTEANSSAMQIHHPICFTAASLVGMMERAGCGVEAVYYHGLGNFNIQYLVGIFKVRK